MAVDHLKAPERCGVYRIRNVVNGKFYIGSAASMRRRAYLHQWSLKRGDHHSRQLQRAWNKHGHEAFVFEPMLFCAREDRTEYERKAIEAFQTADPAVGYNGTGKVLNPDHDVVWTPERRKAHADARRGKPLFHGNPITTANMLAAVRRGTEHHMFGRSHSESSKKKISENRSGIPAWNRGVPSPRKGIPRSPEVIEKMRAAAHARREKTSALSKEMWRRRKLAQQAVPGESQ